MNLENRTVLVTGGATGIGRALAAAFLARGSRVIVCGRSETALDRVRADLPGLVTVRCDVAVASERAALSAWIDTEHRDLDVLVNNAGVQNRPDFRGPVDADALASEIAINLTAPILLTGELLPRLWARPTAAVLNVTSGLAFCPNAEMPVYCATKAAMHSFTLSLRHQLRDTVVRVVEIAPPIVDTHLGGVSRIGDGRPPAVGPDAFAAEVMRQLAEGREEILMGLSAMTRREGEAFFGRMNPH